MWPGWRKTGTKDQRRRFFGFHLSSANLVRTHIAAVDVPLTGITAAFFGRAACQAIAVSVTVQLYIIRVMEQIGL
jgi:hypothetical protein